MTQRRSNTFKIGITGNVCTGKTLVRNTLQRYGVNTLDADEMAFNMLVDNPQRLGIRLTEHFGASVIDNRGRLSRKKLAAILLNDPEKKALFDEKIGPLLREEIKRFLYSPMGSYIRAVESPMLLESETSHLYDEVWVVNVPSSEQVQRLMAREQLPEAEAKRLIDAQWPLERKIGLSDRVIDNSGDLHQTETQVRKVLDEIKHRVYKMGI